MINYVDPSWVHGLNIRNVSKGDSDDRREHATYPAFDDAPHLTEKLHQTVIRQLDRFTRDASMNGTLRSEFNVDWQLTAVSDEVYGVRLRIGESTGSGWSEYRTTVWYDRTDQRALDSSTLLRDDAALAELSGLIGEMLIDRSPQVDPHAVRPDPKLFDSIGFNPRGDLVVEFDDYQVGRGSLGRVAVAVPASEAEPLLSATGIRARRAAMARSQASPMASAESIEAANTAKPPAQSSRAGSVNCSRAKCIALTYDDGPGPNTGRLLDVLRENDARATFFCVGSNASARPELLRRMRQEGHLVGNHTWSHRDLTALPSSRVADQINLGQYAITQAIWQVPTLMRPPYGASNLQVASVARRMGLSVVRWSVNAEDRNDPDPGAIADRVVTQAKPGAIVLLHDIHGSTVDATPEILRRLTKKGYTFVTVPELYGPGGMQPGRAYDSAASGASTGESGIVTRGLEKQTAP